jgi:hypothetical protein
MNEPAPIFCYALYSSWTSRGRVPDRCMGDRTPNKTEEKSIASERRRDRGCPRGLRQRSRRVFQGIAPVSDGGKKRPLECSPGVMHHRRTVGLDIPCQVARLQSLTPLLQPVGNIADARKRTRPASHELT